MDATLAIIAKHAETAQPIAGAAVILSVGQTGTTNGDGYIAFQVPTEWLSYSVHHPQYLDYFSAPINVQGNMDSTAAVTPKPSPRISTSGIDLVRGGVRWFGKGVSFFIGYERFLAGENIRPQLQQLKDLGINCVDVWASYWYIAVNQGREPFHAGLRPDGLTRLAEFHALLWEYDLYALWVAFCDPRKFDKPTAWEVAYWNDLNAALDPIDNVAAIILNNEHNAHAFNKVNRASFSAPPRHVGACSSFTEMKSSLYPMTPKWTAAAFHHGRVWPKILKDACTADHPHQRDLSIAIPVLLDEPIRIDATLASDPMQAQAILERMARIASGSAGLLIAHSEDGKQARLYDAYTLERVQAIQRGLEGV